MSNSKYFTMLVGLPGSGKTTYKLANCQNYVSISTDDFIDVMSKITGKTYNELFALHIKAANAHLIENLAEAIQEGKNIVWDQTNLTKKKRMSVLDRIPRDYVKTCVFFTIPEDVLVNRRAGRDGKTIPKGILDNMRSAYELPSPSEGFDYIMEITE